MLQDDGYIPKHSVMELQKAWPGSEVRWVTGGHVSSFLLHNGEFRRAIVDGLNRLEWKESPSWEWCHHMRRYCIYSLGNLLHLTKHVKWIITDVCECVPPPPSGRGLQNNNQKKKKKKDSTRGGCFVNYYLMCIKFNVYYHLINFICMWHWNQC